MIGKVFKKDGINLCYGESGLGKTVSSIKAVNSDNIVPILLDFDGNTSPENNNCNYTHIDGVKFIASYMAKDAVIPKDQVIIIDTWAMFSVYLETNPMLLEDLHEGNTIIIIGHNIDIASKQDIPDVPSVLVNHWDAKLFMSFDKGSSAKTSARPPSYNLTVMKLRGYKGPRTIINWMRKSISEEIAEMNKLLDKG